MADGIEDDVGGVAGSAFEVPATEVAIGQNWSRKSAQCDRWSFCLTTGRFSLRIRRRLCRDDRAGTTRRLSRRRRYSPPSRAIGRSGLEACSTAHYLNKQTYPPRLSGSGISRDVGASMCVGLRLSGWSRASVVSSANVFAVFLDFLPTARLTDFSPNSTKSGTSP